MESSPSGLGFRQVGVKNADTGLTHFFEDFDIVLKPFAINVFFICFVLLFHVHRSKYIWRSIRIKYSFLHFIWSWIQCFLFVFLLYDHVHTFSFHSFISKSSYCYYWWIVALEEDCYFDDEKNFCIIEMVSLQMVNQCLSIVQYRNLLYARRTIRLLYEISWSRILWRLCAVLSTLGTKFKWRIEKR